MTITPARVEEVGGIYWEEKATAREATNCLLLPYVVRLTKLISKLLEDNQLISKYIFTNFEDVDDRYISNQSLNDK